MPQNGASQRHKASPQGCLTAHICHKGCQDDLGDLCFVGKTNRPWLGGVNTLPKVSGWAGPGEPGSSPPSAYQCDLLSESPSLSTVPHLLNKCLHR